MCMSVKTDQHEALEGWVLDAVPDLLGRGWLLLVDVLHKLDLLVVSNGTPCSLFKKPLSAQTNIETQKVDELAGCVNFRLVRTLRLANHGGGVDFPAVGSSHQIRGLRLTVSIQRYEKTEP